MIPVIDPTHDRLALVRLQAGDLDALGDLFDQYYIHVYRTAVAITRDPDSADDIAQDCFLRLHQYAARIDPLLPVSPWLYRVTVNLCYNWITRQRNRKISLDGLVERLMMPATNAPDRLAEVNETRARIRAAVATLHIHQQIVVVLHYMNGLSVEDIAETLEIPIGTVKSRLYYARENLRRQLSEGWALSELAHGYYAGQT